MAKSRPQFVLTKIALALMHAIAWAVRVTGKILGGLLWPIRQMTTRFVWPFLLRLYKPLFRWSEQWKLFSHSTHRMLSLLTHRLSIKVGVLGVCGMVVVANVAGGSQIDSQFNRFAAGSLLDKVAFPDTDVIVTAEQMQSTRVGWFPSGSVLIEQPVVLVGEPGESPVISTDAMGIALQQQHTITKTVHTRTEVETYTVQGGDSAGSIADQFGLRVQTILDANDLDNVNLIKPGQELAILPVDGVKHTFKKKDTLRLIAKEYNAEIEDILDFNNLDSKDDIKTGQVLIVPDGRIKPAPAPAAPVGIASSVLPSTPVAYGGGHIWPTTATSISSHYGYRWGGFHTGTDIDGNLGDPVWASAPGTVVEASWNSGGYGNMVLIDHGNGTQTRYGHLDSIGVSAGQYVNQGDVVGLEGTTGWSTGPHLHYECIIGGSTVNPLGNCI